MDRDYLSFIPFLRLSESGGRYIFPDFILVSAILKKKKKLLKYFCKTIEFFYQNIFVWNVVL